MGLPNGLKDRVALVTGGSRGIGAAIVRRLAAMGAQIALNYREDEKAAEFVVREATGLGGKVSLVRADLSRAEEIPGLIETVIAEHGRLDILVNNAGVFDSRPLSEIDADHYDRVFDLNVKGLLLVTAYASRVMKDGGRIVNLSSVAASRARAGNCVYAASKAAVEAFTRSNAAELGPRRITVNAVAPGPTETDMLRTGLSSEIVKASVAATALGRLGTPEDIADVVAFLVSEEARWVTGQVIGTHGGLMSR